jgi:hypothetical protein
MVLYFFYLAKAIIYIQGKSRRIYNPKEGNPWWELSISINFGALESP